MDAPSNRFAEIKKPAAACARRRRLSTFTWIAILLFTAALAIANLLGTRYAITEDRDWKSRSLYRHGWPVTWVDGERPHRLPPGERFAPTNLGKVGNQLAGGFPFYNHWQVDRFFSLGAAVNFLAALGVLTLLAATIERWRQRLTPPPSFSLRDLLAIVAFCATLATGWRRFDEYWRVDMFAWCGLLAVIFVGIALACYFIIDSVLRWRSMHATKTSRWQNVAALAPIVVALFLVNYHGHIERTESPWIYGWEDTHHGWPMAAMMRKGQNTTIFALPNPWKELRRRLRETWPLSGVVSVDPGKALIDLLVAATLISGSLWTLNRWRRQNWLPRRPMAAAISAFAAATAMFIVRPPTVNQLEIGLFLYANWIAWLSILLTLLAIFDLPGALLDRSARLVRARPPRQ